MSKTYNGIFITAANNTIREFASDSPDSTIRVKKPTVIVGEYTFNNMPQGPTITWTEGMNKYCTITNTTKVNAGNYTLTIALKDTNNMVWEDLTDEELTYSYSIAKADQTITVSSNSINLDSEHTSATVTVSGNGTALSAVVSDDSVVSATVNGSVITVNNINETTGSATISVTAVGTDNYNVSNTKTISVSAKFIPIVPFATGTETQIKAMLDAYYADELTWADMGWNVGDTRVIHFNEMAAPSGSSASTWAAQDITVMIVDHDHTDLAIPINGHTKSCITVHTRECMNNNTSDMNQAGHIYVNGDSNPDTSFTKWSNLYIRNYLNTTVLNALSMGDFKNSIKQSKHYRHTDYNTSTAEEVIDTFFLPSSPEMFGNLTYNYTVTNPPEGTQFAQYTTQANRVKYGNNNGSSNNKEQFYWDGSASNYCDSEYGGWYFWHGIMFNGDTSGGGGAVAGALAPAWAM